MAFSPEVEKWRALVQEEISKGGFPFPAELILSVIRFESGGKPGIVNPKSGASGLMQVMQVALNEFNKRTGNNWNLAELRRQDPESARKQIQVGLWTLGNFWRGAYNYLKSKLATVPVDELARIGDMFYASGPGAIKPLLDKLAQPLFDAFVARYPTHKGGAHAKNVWWLTTENKPQWNLDSIDKFVSGSEGGEIEKTPKEGFLLALLVVVVVWFFFGKFSGKTEKTD